jgi:hypothetical protein
LKIRAVVLFFRELQLSDLGKLTKYAKMLEKISGGYNGSVSIVSETKNMTGISILFSGG